MGLLNRNKEEDYPKDRPEKSYDEKIGTCDKCDKETPNGKLTTCDNCSYDFCRDCGKEDHCDECKDSGEYSVRVYFAGAEENYKDIVEEVSAEVANSELGKIMKSIEDGKKIYVYHDDGDFIVLRNIVLVTTVK